MLITIVVCLLSVRFSWPSLAPQSCIERPHKQTTRVWLSREKARAAVLSVIGIVRMILPSGNDQIRMAGASVFTDPVASMRPSGEMAI